MSKKYLLALIVFLYSCKGPKNSPVSICINSVSAQNARRATFSQLDPSKIINGTVINTEGVFSYNFEDIALYSNTQKEEKGIWVDFGEKFLSQDSLLKKLNGKKVIITAMIDFSIKGHLNSYLGTLFNIDCIKEIE